MLASLPEDGNFGGKFSKNEEAEKSMGAAEALFSQGKMDEALAAYQKASRLDPTIYEAALFSGDVYMQKGDFPKAEVRKSRRI